MERDSRCLIWDTYGRRTYIQFIAVHIYMGEIYLWFWDGKPGQTGGRGEGITHNRWNREEGHYYHDHHDDRIILYDLEANFFLYLYSFLFF